MRRWVMPNRRQHGVQGKANKHRQGNGEGDRDAKLLKEAPDNAVHVTDRQKHGDDRKGCRSDRQANFCGSIQRGLPVVLAHCLVPYNVFTHDNGIVDQ